MHIQPPTATFPSSSSASTTSPSSTILQNLHILSLDGTGATTLPFMYKDMTVDRLKRSITATLRKPAYMWEELSLYCLGVVMKNEQKLGACGLFDGATIRYSFNNSQRFGRSRQASTASFSNELWNFESCREVPFYEEELRTILSLDTEQSRLLLGVPAKMFVENVLLERGLISSR